MSDLEAIIAGCVRGARKAQMELYNKFSPLMYGICIRYAHDKAEAEDILQEGFLKIFDHVNEFSGKGHFVNWMKKIMVNTAITHFNKNKRHYFHQELDEVKETADVEYTPEDKISTDELLELIKQMPDGYRVVFNLYAIEGFKHKEIAKKLNIDEGTSKSQFLRGKQWLIKKLKKTENIEDGK